MRSSLQIYMQVYYILFYIVFYIVYIVLYSIFAVDTAAADTEWKDDTNRDDVKGCQE